MHFEHHTVVLVRRPTAPPELPEAALLRLWDAHRAHQDGLVEQGHVIAAGPLVGPDGTDAGELCVFVGEPELAGRLYDNDPAVRAGRLSVEVLIWGTPPGNVRFRNVPLPATLLEPGPSPS
ncbi:YciI family protein [Micromonospora sp. NPDC049523]|uniref:YciI family protein n=1 Tax=Micromonospora sp. NPDC049523 TaxID=3155921 RepID=UPI003415E6A4